MNVLTTYDAACRAIDAAVAVDDVLQIRNEAQARAELARRAKNYDNEAKCARIRLRAERRLGQLIRSQKKLVGLHKGGRPAKTPSAVEGVSKATLAEAGIDYKLSAHAQKLADLPEPTFAGMLTDLENSVAKEHQRRLRTVFKVEKVAAARAEYAGRKEHGGQIPDLHTLAASGKKFAVIMADPPWQFEVWSEHGKINSSADNSYNTMWLADIATLPVPSLATADSALFLWVTMPILPQAFALITAWGFTYKTCGFTWVKQNPDSVGLFTGMGYWTRSNSELCLLATRGAPLRLAKDVHQVIMAPVREHSRKPDEVPQRIERLLGGPYLELFGRERRPGWTSWGNEVPAPAPSDLNGG